MHPIRPIFPIILIGLALLCLPAPVRAHATGPDIPSVYDNVPIPVDITPAEITAKVAQYKNNLFFLRSFIFDNAEAEFDGFMIPNGAYATATCSWTKLLGKDGKNILRAPTAKEIERHRFYSGKSYPIYVTNTKADPAYAEGKATLRVPCKFAHVTLNATDINNAQNVGPYAVTLQRCVRNSASLQMQVANVVEPIVIFRDATGGCLKLDSWDGMTGDAMSNRNYTAQGVIAKIDIYYPTEFASATVNIGAFAEPDIMAASRQNTIPVAKSTRYMPPPVQAATATLTLDTLKEQTRVAVQRCYDYTAFNSPEMKLVLPPVINSAFAKIEYQNVHLYDAAGKAVTFYSVKQPSEQYQKMNTTQLWLKEKSAIPTIARVTGTVHIRYPASFKVVTLTKANPRAGAVAVQFNGALLKIAGIDDLLFASFDLRDSLTLVQAYNGNGIPIRRIDSYSGSSGAGNVMWQHFAFWGNPTEARVLTVDNWLTLDIPFDAPLGAKLPDTQRGKKPEGYL